MLTVAALDVSRQLFPAAPAWHDGREVFIGIAIIGVIALCFLFARHTRQRISASA